MDVCTGGTCAGMAVIEGSITVPPVGVTNTITGTTAGGMNNYTSTCASSARSPDHAYTFTVGGTGATLRFETVAPTSYDTALHIRGATCDTATIACNDDGGAGTLSRIQRFFTPGTYIVVVDGFSTGSSGSYRLEVENVWGGIRNFTTCTSTGNTGPTMANCTTAYTGTSLAGEVTVTAGIQRWVAPATGTYRIEAFGAQGFSAQTGQEGGRGARMRGDFALTAGQALDVIVGQRAPTSTCNGGGGGGSWVVNVATSTPLVVAGGGGGTRTSVTQNGCPGRTSTAGGQGSASSGSGFACPARTGGIGNGGIVSGASWGSAGGGLTTNGAGDGGATRGGRAYVNGGVGGAGSAAGGFGGGGAGNGSCGGGGGGGYSGGDGGRIAGGGGSFNSGTTQSNSTGVRIGDGLVRIDLL